MPHIPKAVCGRCNLEMKPVKNGVDVEMLTEDGQGYYKISADRYECKWCLGTILIGFADQPFAENWQEGYEGHEVDEVANFAD